MNTRVGSARWLKEARGIAGKAVSLLDSRHSDLLEDGENRPSLYLAHYTVSRCSDFYAARPGWGIAPI